MGHFEEAQHVLESALKKSRRQTYLSEALSQELTEAQTRMSSRAMWEGGGRASTSDSSQMHLLQRTISTCVSSKSVTTRRSKTMYANRSQSDCIERSFATDF